MTIFVVISKHSLDLLVEETIVVELKAVEKVLPKHEAQLLTYMRFKKCKIGLLLNFNEIKLTDGLKRLILSHT